MSALEEFLTGPYGWLAIFGIVILFTALTMLFYNRYDKYDPEPKSRLIYAFFLGIVSVIPAIILSLIVAGIFARVIGLNAFILAVIIAPVVEEICKIWFVIHLSSSIDFDGPLDGLIYGAMVGAGFAAAENVLYGFAVLFSDDLTAGIFITAIRSVTQIVGHPLYTGLAGVGVGEYKVGLESSQYSKLWRSMGFHALWNAAASISNILMVLLGSISIVIIMNIIVLRRELHRTVELDRKAYERGYYEQKRKYIEHQKQLIRDQIRQTQMNIGTQSSQNHRMQRDMEWHQNSHQIGEVETQSHNNPIGLPEWEKEGWNPESQKKDDDDDTSESSK